MTFLEARMDSSSLMFQLVKQDDQSAVYRNTATGAEFTAEKFGDNVMFPPGTPMELLMAVIDEEPPPGEGRLQKVD